MIGAAGSLLAIKARRLEELLARSSEGLGFEDPLSIDLGLHRWLAADREEAYSDWLQWVVTRLSRVDQVYRLFDLPPPTGWESWGEVGPIVEREVPVPVGHQGHRGRLDLVIRYPERAILLVEVKVTGAEEADTVKHDGYLEWYKDQREPHKPSEPVLLANWAAAEEYRGFRFYSWADVCVALRRMMAERCLGVPRLTQAMMLAFVAAVEQNLLRFSAALVPQAGDGHLPLIDTRVVDHLARAVDRNDHEETRP